MNQLQSLTLRDGTLTSIPDGIVSLPKLQYINFIDHKISSLPSFLYGVNWNTSRLQSVDLRDNPIVIANWEQQQFVNYLHTKLYYFAFQTVTADDFAIVRSILDGNGYQTVDMNKYIITAYGRVTGIYLPPEISLSQIPPGLKTLDSLKEFVIGRHTMTSVPEWLKQQKALQVIHIPNGRLSSLPELLSTMPKLHYLNVSNNNLVAAPAWISTITKWPFQSIVADFSCNRIQPSAIGCKKQDCLIEPQRSEHEIDIDNTLLSKDLEVVKRLFKRHSPYMYTTHIQMPYNYFTRVKNSRVISISLPLISTDFSLLFKDLSELDSLKTLDFEMYWAMKAVSTGIIDEQLKSITVRLPSVTELILGAYQSINRLPDGLLQIVPNVKRVGLRGMSFTSIPDALKNCQGLESVDLFCNKLNNLNEQDKAWMNTYCKTSQTVLARPFGTIYINENENWEKSQVK
jgi:Leucine-rich repeat (LRR) protein